MWTNKQLKEAAKADLSGFYGLSLGVNLVGYLVGNWLDTYSRLFDRLIEVSNRFDDYRLAFYVTDSATTVSWVLVILAFIYSVFVSNHIAVGIARFYVHREEKDRSFSSLWYAFKEERYLPTLITQFVTSLVVSLCYLLLIIPGIIMSYTYCFVPYLIADHPQLSGKEARRLSKKMTDGEKFRIFVLEMSFLGWYLLGAMACGIGIFFVWPYFEATKAQLYKELYKKIDSEWEEVAVEAPSV